MIAKIEPTFQFAPLTKKIDYHVKKIEEGKATELFNSAGTVVGRDMANNMDLVVSLNMHVKNPFIEFILNLQPGETLEDEKLTDMAKEYMSEMGYADSTYSVIKHQDKEHLHVHILATCIDTDGKHISDSNDFFKSGKVAAKLELKYGLLQTDRSRSSNKRRAFGEEKQRQYYFDSALNKALRNHTFKDRVSDLLNQSEGYRMVEPNMKQRYTNEEWQLILGDGMYDKLSYVLESGKFFNQLLKDELLSNLDEAYNNTSNAQEFRQELESKGVYMRLVSKGDKTYYVYGIKEQGFYLKDLSLPQKYRYGSMNFNSKQMPADEQKHYLYNQIFLTLNESSSYEDFKGKLSEKDIEMHELTNAKGVYGLSFNMTGIDTPETFKASDISRKLTYKNLQDHFMNQANGIEPVINRYGEWKTHYSEDMNYMKPMIFLGGLPDEGGKERKADDDDHKRKRKKKKNKGLSL